MPSSDANFDGVLAGTCGGMTAGQLSTDTEETDYQYLVTMAVASATAVDSLVGVTTAPPPLVAQTNLLDEISFGFWIGRNPSSGTNGDTSGELASLIVDDGLLNGVVNAFASAVTVLGAGTAGSTPIFRNNALAGACGGMLASASQVTQTVGIANRDAYDYLTGQAYALATAIDTAIGAIGSPTVVQSNLVCELAFAWTDGRNPGNQDSGDIDYTPIADTIATVYTLGAAAIATPPSGAPTNANVWDAAFCGGLGGMLAGQLSTDDVSADWTSYIAAAAAFAYAIDVEAAAVLESFSGVPDEDLLRQICHAWMRNRNPPQSGAAHATANYDAIAGGIIAYFAEASGQLL